MVIEEKLHVIALRSNTLGNLSNSYLSYDIVLNKLRCLDPTLKGLRTYPNAIAFSLKQLLDKGISFKQAYSIIKKQNNSTSHLNTILYCQAYTTQINTPKYKGYITIYTQPIFSYIPTTRVILRYPAKECLEEVNKIFPNMFVSKAEFTLDLIPEQEKVPKEHAMLKGQIVRETYEDILRHLYMPNRRSTSIKNIGQHGLIIDIDLPTNHAFRISHLKLYERGPDKKRIKLSTGKYGWVKEDLDKIRIEYNINNKILQKWGAETTIVQRGTRFLKLVSLENFLKCDIDPLSELNIMFKQCNKKRGTIYLLHYLSMNNKQKKQVKDDKRLEKLRDEIFQHVNDFKDAWKSFRECSNCKTIVEEEFDLAIEDDQSLFQTKNPKKLDILSKTLLPLIDDTELIINKQFTRKHSIAKHIFNRRIPHWLMEYPVNHVSRE